MRCFVQCAGNREVVTLGGGDCRCAIGIGMSAAVVVGLEWRNR